MTAPRLLLVSPAFHGYWRAIEAALTRRGYEVTTHLYDARGATAKVRHKLLVELPQRWGREQDTWSVDSAAAADALQRSRPDVLLVVKGDTLGADFWEAATAVPRRAVWLYDELRRTSYDPDVLAAAGPIASYSRDDVAALTARGLPALHVPLAFDTDLSVPTRPTTHEVVFVGSRSPAREQILQALAGAGVAVRAFGREWSAHPWDRLRTWRWGSPKLPAGRDVGREDAYAVMAAALATLNVHGDQDGFTMRTFEAAGVGAVQLIDRADVAEFYDPGTEVLVFSSPDEAVAHAHRIGADPVAAARLRAAATARTLAEHTFDHRMRALETLWA